MNNKPCSTREHIESIDKPGFCVWCDAPLRCKACGVSKGHASDCPKLPILRATINDTMPAPAPMPVGIGHGPRGAALAELAECGSDMATLIVAVAAGAQLRLGPQRYRLTGEVEIWRGTLRQEALQAAEGADLLLVISQLAQQWRHR